MSRILNFFLFLFFGFLTVLCGAQSILSDVEWKCDTDSECSIEHSLCINKLCQCLPGYTYNVNLTSCLKVATKFGDRCDEAIQCSRYLLTGATCVKNTCACGPGFHYLHGRCYKTLELFEQCNVDDDCYINSEIGSTICDKGICKCKPGFYQREYRSCRPAAKVLGNDCIIDPDCKSIDNAYCNDDLKCAIPEDIVNEAKSSYNDGAKYADEINEKSEWRDCATDADCNIYENAICGVARKCVCKRAHFVSDNKCVSELGEPCNSNTTDITFAVCRNGVWTCTYDRVPSIDKQMCLKASRDYNFSCQYDEHCYVLGPDAICSDKKCICNEKSRYVKEQTFCWKSVQEGESCKSNEDCYMEGLNGTLVCENNICACSSGTHMNSDRTACINDHAELGMFCDEDDNCATNNSICVNSVCVCDDSKHYYESNKTCVIGIHGACKSNKDCKPANSICLSGTCTCKEDHIAPCTGTCLRVSSYGDKCEYDIQCEARTPKAICAKSTDTSKTKTCMCDKKHHLSSSKCFKKKYLGEACTFYDECYLDFDKDKALCINGICTCDWNYSPVGSTRCVKNLDEKAHPSQFSGGSGITISRIWLTILSFVWMFLSFI